MVDRMPPARGDRNLRIELGRARLPWEQAEQLGPGSVVSLESLIDDPVNVYLGQRLVARGEVLVLDGCFCIRVTELFSGGK
jgi:flagellar motor switch protein FliN/FliY